MIRIIVYVRMSFQNLIEFFIFIFIPYCIERGQISFLCVNDAEHMVWI